MTLREQRQNEFADIWLETGKNGLLHLCPRSGKSKIGLLIFEKIRANKILIAYPDNKIRDSWEREMVKWNYQNDNITFTNTRSLEKYVEEEYDVVVIDEIHTLSDFQIEQCKKLFIKNKTVLGLSGSISSETEEILARELSLLIVANYSIEQAISEGVITDYEINVISVPLDNKIKQHFGKKLRTEKQQFDAYTKVIEKLEKQGRDTKFLRLARMRVIQGSVAKQQKTISLIEEHKEERILIFCGLTKIADSLGIPSYHSKSYEKDAFDEFVNGEGKQLAVCKIGSVGITFTPLSFTIISFFDSNSENLCQKILRVMSMEYDNPEKCAKIYIVSSTEIVEQHWLSHALEMFNEQKINYL
jgi:hypothetical protein